MGLKGARNSMKMGRVSTDEEKRQWADVQYSRTWSEQYKAIWPPDTYHFGNMNWSIIVVLLTAGGNPTHVWAVHSMTYEKWCFVCWTEQLLPSQPKRWSGFALCRMDWIWMWLNLTVTCGEWAIPVRIAVPDLKLGVHKWWDPVHLVMGAHIWDYRPVYTVTLPHFGFCYLEISHVLQQQCIGNMYCAPYVVKMWYRNVCVC